MRSKKVNGSFFNPRIVPVSVSLLPVYSYTKFRVPLLLLPLSKCSFICTSSLTTGEIGSNMFRLSTGNTAVNYYHKCTTWYAKEKEKMQLLTDLFALTRICPCDERLASKDDRFVYDWAQHIDTFGNMRCYYEKVPMSISTQVSRNNKI